MSWRFTSILGTPIQGNLLHKHGMRCLPPCFPPHPNHTGSLRVPSHQLLHQGHCSSGVGILLALHLQGELPPPAVPHQKMSSFFFLVLTLDTYSCCMRSLGWFRTIALDVTRLATSVADGPCSSRGNTWCCSDFSRLTLAGLGATRSLVCRRLRLQYQWALAHHVSRPQA